MKILITGSTGYIGEVIKRELSYKNKIYEITRHKSKQSLEKSIFYTTLDNLHNNYKDDLKILKKQKIECVIHLANEVNKSNLSNNEKIFNTNLNITHSMIKIIKYLKPKIFLNFSSTSVYPYVKGYFDELANVNPSKNNDFFYALSKINSEFLFNNLLSDLNLRIIHLRVAQVISENMPKNRIYPLFKQQLIKKNIIDIYGSGKRKVPIIFFADLIKYINKIINSNFSGIINVGTKNISIESLAKMAIKKIGKKNSKIHFKKGNVKSDINFNVDFTKIRNLK